MFKHLLVLISLSVSTTSLAKVDLIKEMTIEGESYSCRPSNLKVRCPLKEMSTAAAFARNAADGILCLNGIRGTPESFKSDQELARSCFSGAALRKLSDDISIQMVNKECNAAFRAECSEFYKCHELDRIFGGYREYCGYLGEYVDFLVRVKGLPKDLFTEADGKEICTELF